MATSRLGDLSAFRSGAGAPTCLRLPERARRLAPCRSASAIPSSSASPNLAHALLRRRGRRRARRRRGARARRRRGARACSGAGTRLVRIEGLEPGTEYEIEIEVEGADAPAPDRYFPGRAATLPAPGGGDGDLRHAERPALRRAALRRHAAAERRVRPDAPGFPSIRADDTEVPYWRFMNEDAIAEINAAGVDAIFIKGDIADVGRPEQFGLAREAFAKLAMPHHAFLGNHDYYGRLDGLEVDGYALLGQPPRAAHASISAAGACCCSRPRARRAPRRLRRRAPALARAARSTRRASARTPTLLLMHHQPVPPEHADGYPNTIGILPEHSLPLFDLLGAHPQVKGVLIGHTHRNRVRRYPASGRVPFVEVQLHQGLPGRLRALPALRGRLVPPGGAPHRQRPRARPLDALPRLLPRRLPRLRARPARRAQLRRRRLRRAGWTRRHPGGVHA